MNHNLLSPPLSPTHAKASVPTGFRLRTFVGAFGVALFVVLLWGAMGDRAGADEAGDAGSSSAATAAESAVAPPAVIDADPSADAPADDASAEDDATEDSGAPAGATSSTADMAADDADEPTATPVAEADEPASDATAVTNVSTASPVRALADVAPERRRTASANVVAAAPMSIQTHGSAPAFRQCNDDTFPTSAGWEASCVVTVENTVGSDGSTASRVTTTWCLAAAGVLPPAGCTSEVTTSGTLVTSVEQCNGILAGGSNVTCRVEVINNVPFGATTTGVTVNQCVGSGQGGVSPSGPPTDCNPAGSSTTGATVTQCNGSANGGGGPERVQCSVTGGASALPVTVNQCNGSTAAGSTVTCDVTYTNNFAAAAVDPGGTPSATPAVTPVVPVSSPATPSDGGRTARFTSAGSSTSSGTSVTDSSSSTSTSTSTSLADTGPGASTGSLLSAALLLLLLGSLLLAGAGAGGPGRRVATLA